MASRQTRRHLNPRRVTRRCESQKVSYPTYEEALVGAEHMMDQGRVDPGCHITPYRCDRCGQWHVANRVIVPDGRRRGSRR
jgi:hypothetical protein